MPAKAGIHLTMVTFMRWIPAFAGMTLKVNMEDASNSPLYFAAHIFCCTNQRPPGHKRGCCADKGAEGLRNYMKKRAKEMGIKGIRVNGAGCLDRCELGPCFVVYPEGVWYSPKTEADIDEILVTHLQQGKRVEHLMLPPREVQP